MCIRDRSGEWSDINHILALSAVLETPIDVHHPTLEDIASPFSRVIRGRGVQQNENLEPIRIMWTSTVFPQQFTELQINHFVPLVSLEQLDKNILKGKRYILIEIIFIYML